MLGHGSNSGHAAQALGLHRILHLGQGILPGPVAVNAHQDRLGSVALNFSQPLQGADRHTAAVSRNGKDHQVLLRKAQRLHGSGQVPVLPGAAQGRSQDIAHLAGTAGGAEMEMILHGSVPPLGFFSIIARSRDFCHLFWRKISKTKSTLPRREGAYDQSSSSMISSRTAPMRVTMGTTRALPMQK